MLSGDVPKREEGDEEERHQCDGFLVVHQASLINLKERADLQDAILYCEDRVDPECDVLALLPQSLLLSGVSAGYQRSIWRRF